MASGILRKVVTRFKFETDPGDVKKYDTTISGMKSGLKTLAAAFGITLGIEGARQMVRLGLSAEQAKLNLDRALLGPDRIAMVAAWTGRLKMVTAEMGRLGISVNDIELNKAAASWIQSFGKAAPAMEQFTKLFTFAQKEARLTGNSVNDIMEGLQAAISGGGFEVLMRVPGFTENAKKWQEFLQSIRKTGDPGGMVDMSNNMNVLLRLTDKFGQEQNDALKIMPRELKAADEAGKRLQKTLEDIAAVLTTKLVPALESLAEFLNPKPKPDSSFSLFGILGMAKKAADARGAEYDRRLPTGPDLYDLEPVKSRSMLSGRIKASPVTKSQSTTVNNTFNITGADPQAIARAVSERTQQSVQDAYNAMIPTENR